LLVAAVVVVMMAPVAAVAVALFTQLMQSHLVPQLQ
jgi:hypothetical protein